MLAGWFILLPSSVFFSWEDVNIVTSVCSRKLHLKSCLPHHNTTFLHYAMLKTVKVHLNLEIREKFINLGNGFIILRLKIHNLIPIKISFRKNNKKIHKSDRIVKLQLKRGNNPRFWSLEWFIFLSYQATAIKPIICPFVENACLSSLENRTEVRFRLCKVSAIYKNINPKLTSQIPRLTNNISALSTTSHFGTRFNVPCRDFLPTSLRFASDPGAHTKACHRCTVGWFSPANFP